MCLSSLEEIGNLREDYMWVSDGGRLWYGLTVLGIRFPLQFDTRYFFDLSIINFGMLMTILRSGDVEETIYIVAVDDEDDTIRVRV